MNAESLDPPLTATTIWDLLDRRADATPEATFGVDELRREMSFSEFRERSIDVAAGLADLGIGAGSVVSWQLPSWIEAATLTMALCHLGAIQNPLIPILRAREVGFICRQARTDLLIVPGEWRGFDYEGMGRTLAAEQERMHLLVASRKLPAGPRYALPARHGGAPSAPWYFYTSGTTADPKGAKHSDTTLLAAATGFVDSLGLSAHDRVSLVIPITHVGGIIHILASLLTGGTSVFAEAFEPEATTRQLREQAATIVPGGLPFVQVFFAFADRHPEIAPLFPDARAMTHGGSPKPPVLFHETRARFGLPIVSGYGMTECPMAVWNRPDDEDEDLALTEGRPVPGVELRTVGLDGSLMPPGEEGEVRLRGPQLMEGYVEASLDGPAFDEQGFFRSGDLGILDGAGRLRITGRLKDIIIRNMENISATELENLLFTHPKVGDVAVIGIRDARTGERACAIIVPTDPGDPPHLAELQAHLRATGLSDRKLPEQLELVDSLPRNAMEKILKKELRQRFDPTAPTHSI